MKSNLKIGFCSYDAAKYACLNWHYSKSVPVGKSVKIGVWEDGNFIGCVFFSRGANSCIGKPYNLKQDECCELTRIALTNHIAPVSRILSLAIKMLKKQCPGIRLIISYADTAQNHHGGIYQATNWIYVGLRDKICNSFIINGKLVHSRTISSLNHAKIKVSEFIKTLDKNAKPIKSSAKHKYLMPLDDEIRKQVLPLAKPYPVRVKQCDDCDLQYSDGAEPIHTLHLEDK